MKKIFKRNVAKLIACIPCVILLSYIVLSYIKPVQDNLKANVLNYTPPAVAENRTSMYIWEPDPYVTNLVYLDTMVDYLNIGMLHIDGPAEDSAEGLFTAEYDVLFGYADTKGLDYYVIYGHSDENHEQSIREVENLIDKVYYYNNCNDYNYRIKGITIDSEFYTSASYTSASEEEKLQIYTKYVTFMKVCCVYAHERGLEYIACIPGWYDQLSYELTEELIAYGCDWLQIMNYDHEGMTERIDKEVFLSKKYNRKIENIAEFQKPREDHGVTADNTFWFQGVDACINKFKEIEQYYNNKYNYHDIIFSYHYYIPLVELFTNIMPDINQGYNLITYPTNDSNTLNPSPMYAVANGKKIQGIPVLTRRSHEYEIYFPNLRYDVTYTFTFEDPRISISDNTIRLSYPTDYSEEVFIYDPTYRVYTMNTPSPSPIACSVTKPSPRPSTAPVAYPSSYPIVSPIPSPTPKTTPRSSPSPSPSSSPIPVPSPLPSPGSLSSPRPSPSPSPIPVSLPSTSNPSSGSTGTGSPSGYVNNSTPSTGSTYTPSNSSQPAAESKKNAEISLGITANKTDFEVGTEFNAVVSIKEFVKNDSSGINKITGEITFDKEKLQLLPETILGLGGWTIDENNVEEDKITFTASRSDYTFYNGEVLKIGFKINESALNQEVVIALTAATATSDLAEIAQDVTDINYKFNVKEAKAKDKDDTYQVADNYNDIEEGGSKTVFIICGLLLALLILIIIIAKKKKDKKEEDEEEKTSQDAPPQNGPPQF